MVKSWLILLAAIVFEVGGTSCLKLSDGLTKIWPSIFVFVFYGLSLWGMSLVLKKIDVGITYAVWAGLGTAIVAVIGVYFFGEKMTTIKICSLVFIIVGVVGLNYSSTAS